MAKSQSLAAMSVDALIKLRDDIGAVLSSKVGDLRRQLSALTGGDSIGYSRKRGPKAGALKGRKVSAKYRHPKTGRTWSGRGAALREIADDIKAGAKLEDFLIAKATTKKSPAKKSKK